jgi:hypothetical protein
MKKVSLVIIFIVLYSLTSLAQGCNDAGLCTMGDFGGINNSGIQKYQSSLTYSFGLGEQQTIIQTIQLDQRIVLLENKWHLNYRIPFMYIYGNLAETYGLGDVSLGVSYVISKSDGKYRTSVFFGSKLPVNDANKSVNGKGLPMVYQTSLGTYDLMAGINLSYQTWLFGLGYQQPFGNNKNTFQYAIWEGNEDALQYFQSAYLKRGADVIARTDKYFELKKNQIKTGLVAIFRVVEDEIKIDDQLLYPDESKGLTLNINLEYQIFMKNHDKIHISVAAPLITREYRTDGLTRTFVLALTYAFGKRPDDILKPVKIGNDH